MNSTAQKQAAKKFAEHWKGKGYEKDESQPFWLSLLRDVFGVEHPEEIVSFESQAKRYASELPLSKHPRYVVTCNFKSFLVYDMENPQGEPEEVLLENLEREFSRLNFLVDVRSEALNYLKAAKMKIGLLVNFGETKLKWERVTRFTAMNYVSNSESVRQ